MMNLSLPSEFTIAGVEIDQTQTEFAIFFSNFRIVNHDEILATMANKTEEVKSVRLSQINREKGNEAYLKRDFRTALEFYYSSIAYAPYDSVEYGLAIGNRSAGLFSIKKYEDCLMDIENIWDTKYPEEQLFKIYVRQSECYLNLEQYSKAFESTAKAREYLNKFKNTISRTKYGKVQKQINKIFAQIKPFDANIAEYEITQPELKDGENPKFLSASNVVDLKYNDTMGRYVVTKTDIEKGDILFVEKPYSAVRVDDLKFRYTYCSYCLVYNPTTIPCNGCTVHFYCSHNCKQLSWDKAHKWECVGEKKNLLTPAMRLPLNIMFKAAENHFKTLVEDESVYGNKGDNFAFVDKLVTNKSKMTNEEISNFTKISIWLVIYLKKYTDFFNWLHEQPTNSGKSISELYDLVGGVLLKLCMQIQCNSNEIVDVSLANLEDFDVDFDFIGYGLYVTTSMINHSCTPNALVSYNQDLKIIRATKKIPKDSEITINYTNFSSMVQTIAPTFLFDALKFKCTCMKCTYPIQNAEDPWLCYRCQGKAFNSSATEASCINCQRTFSIFPYKHIETALLSSYMKAVSTGNSRLFDNIFTVIKTIYHPQHEEFATYYMLSYDFYIAKHDAEKCLNTSKMFVQHCETYCDTDLLKLQSYLRLMNATAIYYGLTQQNQVPPIDNFETYFREVLEKTKDLLKFFVSAQNVKSYDSCFQDYLTTYN